MNNNILNLFFSLKYIPSFLGKKNYCYESKGVKNVLNFTIFFALQLSIGPFLGSQIILVKFSTLSYKTWVCSYIIHE